LKRKAERYGESVGLYGDTLRKKKGVFAVAKNKTRADELVPNHWVNELKGPAALRIQSRMGCTTDGGWRKAEQKYPMESEQELRGYEVLMGTKTGGRVGSLEKQREQSMPARKRPPKSHDQSRGTGTDTIRVRRRESPSRKLERGRGQSSSSRGVFSGQR